MTDVKAVVKADHCEPSCPCPETPTTQQDEPCMGTFTGAISGTVQMECCCCCPQLRTRTFHVDIGPRTLPALIAFLQNTTAAWENGGYVILAHSITDTGSNWLLGLTVGWYAP